MNGETTQDLGQYAPSTNYRYVVRHIGTRRANTAQFMPEYGTECVDSWTGNVMTIHWAGSAELSSLVAETQCAERNAPATSITFPSKLALFIARANASEDHTPGEVLEDVAKILEWHLGRVRGLMVEPLDVTKLYHQAPEFNS
jgi:hypothetical protein